MFERYTERARRAIFFGREEAGKRGSPFIDLEHLLLGLLREDKLLLSLLPEGAVEAISAGIDAVTPGYGPASPHSVDLPLSDGAKRVLMFAADEADRLGDQNIEASYLLLGMLGLETGTAARVLEPYGINFASYRKDAGVMPSEWRPARNPNSPSLVETIAAIEALLERTSDLRAFSAAAGEQRLKRKPWSRKEALGHLIDWATAHHQWFARALSEPKLIAIGFPGENWATMECYADLPWRQVVDLWASLNRFLVHVLRQIPEDKLSQPCRIGIAEPIPLEQLIGNYLDHVEDVLGQILTRGQAG